jgi:outer membrane receptor protein involved in Fe transport
MTFQFRHISLVFFLSTLSFFLYAQPGPGGQKPTGRVYGKVVEGDSKSPVEYAVLQVFRSVVKGDSTTKQLISGGLSASNGDFSVDNVPVGEELLLQISFVGFEPQDIKFQLPRGPMPEKDLGNIKLLASVTTKAVVIEEESAAFKMEFDKRVYDVEKNGVNAGGTGEDVLRNIPSLQVDVDGNVSLRNASPTIFVDGRPTTLTIDQIPADAIQRVEIITNPSAKYDSNGGGGGIVNIVMKHNRSTGYNGSVRAGIDKRQKFNGGFDINAKQGKINVFASGNLNQRKVISTGYADRFTYASDASTRLYQSQQSVNNNLFMTGRAGIDWFADNRNTFTLSGNYTQGQFQPFESIEANTDTISQPQPYPSSKYYRFSDTKRQFSNLGGSFLYKHLFAKEGTELTADLNVNAIESQFDGFYSNYYDDGDARIQTQTGGVKQTFITSQVDYVNKLNDKTKIEAGARAAVRDYTSGYDNYLRNNATAEFERITALAVNYAYFDQVYAAYATFSKDLGKWKYQAGLRAESSKYDGKLLDTTVTFGNKYPLVLLPSGYLSHVINEKNDIQISLNRKVSRPSFMQLSPFTDLSDSLNVTRGNPNLRPEFAHNLELSYQYVPNKKNAFIASAYGRYTTNITVRYQLQEFSPVMNQDIVVTSYANANYSLAYGLELVAKNSLTPWLDLTTNLNFYNSAIDGTNITSNLTNNVSSWWAKMNMMVKLPSNFTFQVLGDYTSRKALDVGSSERGGMGGGGFGGGGGMPGGGFGGTGNTVQGYVRPQYGVDLSLRKELFKNRSASITLSFTDVFRSRINFTHGESPFFVQDTFRRRDPQFWRLNFSWKFGKIDATIFRRKNMKSSDGGAMEG